MNVETTSNVLTVGYIIRKRPWSYDLQYVLQLYMPPSKDLLINQRSYINICKSLQPCDVPVILGENGLGGCLSRVLLIGWLLNNCLGRTLLCMSDGGLFTTLGVLGSDSCRAAGSSAIGLFRSGLLASVELLVSVEGVGCFISGRWEGSFSRIAGWTR